jgi:hypothetical protein
MANILGWIRALVARRRVTTLDCTVVTVLDCRLEGCS